MGLVGKMELAARVWEHYLKEESRRSRGKEVTSSSFVWVLGIKVRVSVVHGK